MNVENWFEQQIQGGAKEMFFYGIESDEGNMRIKSHRGTLDTFPTDLKFSRMVASTPFFTNKMINEDRKSIKSTLGYSRVGMWGNV
jgi:hypothetical protein